MAKLSLILLNIFIPTLHIVFLIKHILNWPLVYNPNMNSYKNKNHYNNINNNNYYNTSTSI